MKIEEKGPDTPVGYLDDVDCEPSADDLSQEAEVSPDEIESGLSKMARKSGIDGYIAMVRQYRVLSHEEMVDLGRKAKTENWAKEKMILHNLRLVIYFAYDYLGYHSLGVDDLIQEGNIGLMKAVERWDPNRGYLFSTYAIWWIKALIRRTIANQGNDIRLPEYVVSLRRKIRKVAEGLMAKLGHRPEIQEIADLVGCSVQNVRDAFEMSGTVSFSIDQPISDEDDGSHHESIAGDQNISPATILLAREEIVKLQIELSTLIAKLESLSEIVKPRHISIFRVYHSLDYSFVIYSDLESVGSEFGLTRESVRQILKRLWRLLGQYYPELLRGPEFLAEIQDKMERLAMHLDGSLPVAPKVTLPKVQKLERQKNWRKSIHFRMSPAFEKGITSETLKRDRVSLLIELVALAYELDSADIREAKRLAEIIWARDLSLYLLSRELGMGIVKILPYFAKTNPQQLVHACRRIESSLKNDPVVKKEIEDLRTLFRQVTQSVR